MSNALVTLHRWIGIGLCLLFAAWFASGLVMLYVPFPSLSQFERLDSSPALDLTYSSAILATLSAAGIGKPNRVRLIQHIEGPLLVVDDPAGQLAAYFLESAMRAPAVTASQAEQIAADFSGVDVADVSEPIDYDQWIVHQQFDPFRPFFRVALADDEGTALYVSSVSGEVLQKTTARERAWNYFGAVVHWIYPTVIRKSWALWDQLVWWLSLVGIIGAVLGVVLGVQRFQLARRRGFTGLATPFAGWMAWHHKLGLLFGVVVVLWIFSGWLSMDHGRLFSVPDPGAEQIIAVRGMELRDAVNRVGANQLAQFAGAKEIEFSAIADNAIVVARNASTVDTLVIDTAGEIRDGLSSQEIEAAVAQAWPMASITASYMLGDDDIYTNLREGSLGTDVMRVELNDPAETWVHIDTRDGRIVSVMDRSRRTYRWLYNGLHSLDFPGLVNRRPLWDVIMVLLMVGGLVFSVTGLVIAYRHLRRTLRAP